MLVLGDLENLQIARHADSLSGKCDYLLMDCKYFGLSDSFDSVKESFLLK
jgi:hypothetical protein